MKKIALILLITGCLFFTGCNEDTSGTVSGSTTQKTNFEDVNKELLSIALVTGPTDAKVTVIEASDFECPACRYWHPQFEKVIEKYIDQVQFGYAAFPLNYHANAKTAAYAVEAAKLQNKGYEMYKKLFEGEDLDINKIEAIAKDLGLDIDQFNADQKSQQTMDNIEKSINILTELNIQGTPTFYINGQEFSGTPTLDQMSPEIDKLLSQQ